MSPSLITLGFYVYTRGSLIEASPPEYKISLEPVLVLLIHLSVPHPGATHQQELCTLYHC